MSGNVECDRCGMIGPPERLVLKVVKLDDGPLCRFCPRCVPTLLEAVASIIPPTKGTPLLARLRAVAKLTPR